MHDAVVSGNGEHYEERDSAVSGECDKGCCLAGVLCQAFSEKVMSEGSSVMLAGPQDQKHSIPSCGDTSRAI